MLQYGSMPHINFVLLPSLQVKYTSGGYCDVVRKNRVTTVSIACNTAITNSYLIVLLISLNRALVFMIFWSKLLILGYAKFTNLPGRRQLHPLQSPHLNLRMSLPDLRWHHLTYPPQDRLGYLPYNPLVQQVHHRSCQVLNHLSLQLRNCQTN